jgi:UDP-glucose 4-epimerase
MLKNKSFLILGGTGSFGKAMTIRLLKFNVKKIIIFSRDELKQFEMRNEIYSNKVEYHIGDIRDKSSLKFAMQNVDYIFFAAALKQVPSCEFFPDEAVKTNFFGALNVIELANDIKIKKIIFLSTDKAVEPINSMGMSKSLMEKLVSSKSLKSKTELIITRYGNVLSSRGSVLPIFINTIQNNGKAYVTSKDMTRFMMKMDVAIDLVLFALANGKSGCIYVRKCPSSNISTLARAAGAILNKKISLTYTGIRAGEKIHETLISKFEMIRTKSFKTYFEITPEIKYNYNQFMTKGISRKLHKDYNSSYNLLDIKKLIKLIRPEVLKLI